MFVILLIHKLSVFDYQLLTGHFCLTGHSVTRDYNAGLEVSPGIDHPLPSVVLPGNTPPSRGRNEPSSSLLTLFSPNGSPDICFHQKWTGCTIRTTLQCFHNGLGFSVSVAYVSSLLPVATLYGNLKDIITLIFKMRGGRIKIMGYIY